MTQKSELPPLEPLADAEAAERCCAGIHALGDYEHVTVRPQRGLLYVYGDDPTDAVARLHPLKDGTYGLSFLHFSGRWQRMPFNGDLDSITETLVETLGPYLSS